MPSGRRKSDEANQQPDELPAPVVTGSAERAVVALVVHPVLQRNLGRCRGSLDFLRQPRVFFPQLVDLFLQIQQLPLQVNDHLLEFEVLQLVCQVSVQQSPCSELCVDVDGDLVKAGYSRSKLPVLFKLL